MTSSNNKPQQQISLLNESTTFTRIPNPNSGEDGEWLEVKVTTKVKTQLGITHDTTQTFLLNGGDASDTLASLRVIHNNLQLSMMKLQQELERATAESAKESTEDSPELAESSTTTGV